ncbi:MAG: protein-export chaperone SecB [Gemmatimonadales bacterium]|nr:protein-export chaperone SecB [Gemmatimonadales bacterium]
MTHRVSSEQLSALQFERVWVREAVFLDIEGEKDSAAPQAHLKVGIRIEVKVAYSPRGDGAFVTVRAALDPPADERLFRELTAAVEGEFSVRGGVDRQRLESFATTQAPVLLLPYLRQVLTTLTAQSRVGAIVMPPLNMVEITKAMQAQAKDKPAAAVTAQP